MAAATHQCMVLLKGTVLVCPGCLALLLLGAGTSIYTARKANSPVPWSCSAARSRKRLPGTGERG